MSTSTFDTLTAARELKAAGIEPEPAEAIAEGMRRDVSADLYRALWIQAAALIGTQLAIAGFVVDLLTTAD